MGHHHHHSHSSTPAYVAPAAATCDSACQAKINAQRAKYEHSDKPSQWSPAEWAKITALPTQVQAELFNNPNFVNDIYHNV